MYISFQNFWTKAVFCTFFLSYRQQNKIIYIFLILCLRSSPHNFQLSNNGNATIVVTVLKTEFTVKYSIVECLKLRQSFYLLTSFKTHVLIDEADQMIDQDRINQIKDDFNTLPQLSPPPKRFTPSDVLYLIKQLAS